MMKLYSRFSTMRLSDRAVFVAVVTLMTGCLAISTAGVLGDAGRLPTVLRHLASTVTVFLLPGLPLVLLLRRYLRPDVLELIPLGIAVNLIVLSATCVATLELHANVRLASQVLVGLDWLSMAALLASALLWGVRASSLRASPLVLAFLPAILVVSVLAFRIGGLRIEQEPDREEEAEQISVIKKLSVLTVVTPTNLMYVADAPTTYYYPTYHFALAMMSSTASVEPISVYAKFHGFATIGSLLSFYAAARALFAAKPIALSALAAGLVLVLNGQASFYWPYWGLLTPQAHVADFGLGLMILLEVLFCIRFIRGGRGHVFFLVLTPLLMLAAMTIHAREVAHVLSYVAPFPIALLALRSGTWRLLLRTLALLLIVLAIARIYQQFIGSRVDHIQYIEQARHAYEVLRLRLGAFDAPLLTGSMGQLVQILAPIPGVLLLVSPLLLLGLRRHLGILFMVSGVLAWATVTTSDLAEQLLALGSYSEIMATPTRYVYHFGFWIIGLGVLGCAMFLDDETKRLGSWIDAWRRRVRTVGRQSDLTGGGQRSPQTLSATLELPVGFILGAFAVALFVAYVLLLAPARATSLGALVLIANVALVLAILWLASRQVVRRYSGVLTHRIGGHIWTEIVMDSRSSDVVAAEPAGVNIALSSGSKTHLVVETRATTVAVVAVALLAWAAFSDSILAATVAGVALLVVWRMYRPVLQPMSSGKHDVKVVAGFRFENQQVRLNLVLPLVVAFLAVAVAVVALSMQLERHIDWPTIEGTTRSLVVLVLLTLMGGIGLRRWLVRGSSAGATEDKEASNAQAGAAADWPREASIEFGIGRAQAHLGASATRAILFIALLVVGAFVLIWLVDGPLPSLAALLAGLSTTPDPRYLWLAAVVGVLVAVAGAWRGPRRRGAWDPWPRIGRRTDRLIWFAVVPLAALLVSSASPSLLKNFQTASTHPDLRNFETWYDGSAVNESLPVPIRDALLADAPGKLVAADGKDGLVVTMFTPHYLVHSGVTSVFSTDFRYLDEWASLQETPPDYLEKIDWPTYEQKLGAPLDEVNSKYVVTYESYKRRIQLVQDLMTKIRPIYNEEESDAQTLRYVQEWKIDYILAMPSAHLRLSRLMRSTPTVFENIAVGGDRSLYRVRRPE